MHSPWPCDSQLIRRRNFMAGIFSHLSFFCIQVEQRRMEKRQKKLRKIRKNVSILGLRRRRYPIGFSDHNLNIFRKDLFCKYFTTWSLLINNSTKLKFVDQIRYNFLNSPNDFSIKSIICSTFFPFIPEEDNNWSPIQYSSNNLLTPYLGTIHGYNSLSGYIKKGLKLETT